jgi:large subunit ribosomal protein L15
VRKNQPVKVLGTGDITVAVDVKAHRFSSTPAEKIARRRRLNQPALGRSGS